MKVLFISRQLLIICLALFCHSLAVAQSTSPAPAGKRFALVIGNSKYLRGPLENPGNDAFVMGKVLQQLGFEVAVHYDLSRGKMNLELDELAKRGKDADAILVYFSGHGVQEKGKNFLLPVEAVLSDTKPVPENAVSVDKAIATIGNARANVNIFILDACRNNPSEDGLSRNSENGFVRVEPGKGTLIAFSTSPGGVAADGKAGGNSVFTEALAKTLADPNRAAEDVFKRVREMVVARTNRKQIPWLNSGLTGGFVFNRGVDVKLPGSIPSGGQSANSAKLRDAGTGSMVTPTKSNNRWPKQLTPQEWAQLDWEIDQRARRVTLEDLSELTGRAYDGEAKAQVMLGDAYLIGVRSGSGWIRSNQDAKQWYRRAAAQGYPLAQVRIGEMFYESRGTDRNLAEAQRWLELAAAQGLVRAKVNLAQLKIEGEGKLNPNAAIELMRQLTPSQVPIRTN